MTEVYQVTRIIDFLVGPRVVFGIETYENRADADQQAKALNAAYMEMLPFSLVDTSGPQAKDTGVTVKTLLWNFGIKAYDHVVEPAPLSTIDRVQPASPGGILLV